MQRRSDGVRAEVGYVLGVDLGTTFTAAAISRRGRTEIVPLGDHAPQIPSAVFLTDSGEYLVGDAALRRGHTEPGRLAREFKRRIGDQTNIVLGTSPISAHALMAQLLAWVVNHVTAAQGEAPHSVVLTHPANWGPYRLELLAQVARTAGLSQARLCSEPEAAAIHFASTQRVEIGHTIAIYDLGGGTFDAAVLRKNSAEAFTVLGAPEGIEHLGGLDFDAAVLHHVQESLGPLDIDPDDPTAMAALTRLARECTEAKEGLSVDNHITIPVTLGSSTRQVRLSRPEFEEAIRPALEETIAALRRSLDSAATTAEDLSAIVLIGGSSRIPLVTHLLTEQTGRPIALSAQPKHAVALGATRIVDSTDTQEHQSDAPASSARQPRRDRAGSTDARALTPGSRPTPAGQRHAPRRPPRVPARRRANRRAVVASALLGVAAVLLALVGPAAEEPIEIGLDRSTGLTTEAPSGLPVAEGSSMTLTLAGLPPPGTDPARVEDGVYNLNGYKAYTAGPLRAVVKDPAGSETQVLVTPVGGSWWSRMLTIPGGVLVVGVLFAFAYAESLLVPVARGRAGVTAKTVAGMSGVGAVIGVVLVLAVWILVLRLVTPPVFAAVVVLALACAGLLPDCLRRTSLTSPPDRKF